MRHPAGSPRNRFHLNLVASQPKFQLANACVEQIKPRGLAVRQCRQVRVSQPSSAKRLSRTMSESSVAQASQ
jgi:hypothetical protein